MEIGVNSILVKKAMSDGDTILPRNPCYMKLGENRSYKPPGPVQIVPDEHKPQEDQVV